MNNTIETALANAMTYEAYMDMFENMVKTNATTGTDQSELLVNFTKLNYRRMTRLNKTIKLSDELVTGISEIPSKMKWIIISEVWCGDAAQNIPVMHIMAEANPNINLRIILRDENPDLMNRYLTNGGKSIPKMICLDENLNELGTWGPRPAILQDWLKKEKANPTMEMSELKEQFQIWYTKDKGQTHQKEMLELIKGWLKKECH